MSKKQFIITDRTINVYINHLKAEEKSAATIEKYTRAVRAFASWLSGDALTKESAVSYKAHIMEHRAAAGVNAEIAALNGFFAFHNIRVKLKPLKIQQQTYRIPEKELTREEYERLLRAARSSGNTRLNLAMQAICSTGIRVSELRHITVEAAQKGKAEVMNKGKTRLVFLPGKLKTALLAYARERGITSGCIFITATGKPLNRSNIWADMKKLCEAANVEPSKVFPHNLRKVFARAFYAVEKDLARLADILGHTRIETTRIYVMETGAEHRRRVENLGLVV
jgi:site-specific recombinase XerD